MPALYSHTTRATGSILTANIYNSDHQNHIDNGIPTQLDDYSSTIGFMQSTTDPGGVGTESLATNLAGELERLRFALKNINDGAQWYSNNGKWLQAGTGAVARKVGDRLRDFISVKDFGATGDGTTDDTTFIQNALNHASSNNVGVYFPIGAYKISSKLTYTGAAGNTMSLIAQKSGRTPSGAVIKWYGTSGGIMLEGKGWNTSSIEGLGFDSRGIALGCVSLLTNQPAGGSGSSGIVLKDLSIIGGVGTGSYCVNLGDSTQQVSEITFYGITLVQSGANGNTDYGILTNTGNTKNFNVIHGSITGFKYGVFRGPTGGGSGFFNFYGTTFGNNTITDIYTTTADTIVINGCGSENSARLIDGAGSSANPYGLNVIGTYFNSNIIASDIVIKWNGQLSLCGNSFINGTGSNIPKIITGAAELTTGGTRSALVSFNNFYQNVSNFAPIYDTAGDSVFGINNANYTAKSLNVFSFGDVGGTAGSLNSLTPVIGRGAYNAEAMIYSPQENVSGFTYGPVARPSRVVHKVIIDKAVWKAAALNQSYTIFQLLAKNTLVSIIADTTQVYAGAGLTGTISLKLGIASVGDNSLVLDHDVKTAAVTKGLADTDLGTSINRANAVQGGYVPWTQQDITIKLTSGVGNLGNGTVTNLTSGSTTLYIITERIG